MKKTTIISTSIALAVLVFGLMSTQALAYGPRYEENLATKANFLSTTVEQLKEWLAEKNFLQIAQDQGKDISEFRESMKERAEERMRSRGLSEEAIQERLQEREQRFEECQANGDCGTCDGTARNGFMRGYGRGFGQGYQAGQAE